MQRWLEHVVFALFFYSVGFVPSLCMADGCLHIRWRSWLWICCIGQQTCGVNQHGSGLNSTGWSSRTVSYEWLGHQGELGVLLFLTLTPEERMDWSYPLD